MRTKCIVDKQTLDHTECLACAANGTRGCGYSYPMLKSLFKYAGYARTGIHVSDLVSCPRKVFYRATEPSEVGYPQERVATYIGTLVHAMLERADDPEMLSEINLTAEYNGVTVTGRCDAYLPRTHTLMDFKTTRALVTSRLPYAEHATQLQIYANMLRKMGTQVDRAVVQYIDLTGASKCSRCRVQLAPGSEPGRPVCPECGQVYPGKHLGAVLYEVDLAPSDDDTWIAERAHRVAAAVSGTAQPGTPGWLCGYCPFKSICPDAE